ncbi:MAG: tripartite tricarboxylate transporter substrate binding protein, partial [Comamonadaceae bacterium]
MSPAFRLQRRCLGAALLALAATQAPAQDKFPSRPVELIVPYAAAGGIGDDQFDRPG